MTKPMQFKDAESCLNLTIQAMRLDKLEDRDFLCRAMKTYAALVIKEENDGFFRAEEEFRASAPELYPAH